MKDLAKLKGKMSETGLSSVVGIKVSPSTLQMLLECESKIIDYCRLCHLGHMFLLLDQIGSLSISRHLSTSTSLNMCDFGRFDFVMCEMGEPCGATTNSRLAQPHQVWSCSDRRPSDAWHAELFGHQGS